MNKEANIRPIFITGVQRSGVSLIAKIVNDCGAFSGNVSKMYENLAIKKLLDQYYKEQIHKDPNGQYPLPDTNELVVPVNWREKVLELLRKEGFTGGPFLIKTGRLAQTWPLWFWAFPEASWIIVRRKTPDVINSCVKTSFMNAYTKESVRKEIGVQTEQEGWLHWVHYHEARFTEMITEGLDCKVIWPQRFLNGDFGQVHELCRWLGLRWNSSVISSIDEVLNKTRIKEQL